MNRIRTHLILPVAFSFLLLAGCQEPTNKNSGAAETSAAPSVNDMHSSANALDWEGTYSGTIPCADCTGISTTITLKHDSTFLLLTKYEGRDTSMHTQTGSFAWNSDGNSITLIGIKNAPSAYYVGENKLMQADMDGKRISGALADKYVLIKKPD